MPARNMQDTIEQALRSVLSSSEVSEVIVVDDGSTDETVTRVLSLADRRVKLLEGPQAGVASALNMAFAAVSADYVARCDADDCFTDGRLGSQLAWLEAHPDFVAVSAAYFAVSSDERTEVVLSADGTPREVSETLRNGDTVSHFGTFLTRTATIRAISGARSWFVTGSDVDLQFRIGGAGRVWHDPNLKAYRYRLHDQSITHRHSGQIREFYHSCARAFARQRREEGADDLMLGYPPEPPLANDASGRETLSASKQIAGHLEGKAWRAFQTGKKGQAFEYMWRAVSTTPYDLRRWKSASALIFKSLRPRI